MCVSDDSGGDGGDYNCAKMWRMNGIEALNRKQ